MRYREEQRFYFMQPCIVAPGQDVKPGIDLDIRCHGQPLLATAHALFNRISHTFSIVVNATERITCIRETGAMSIGGEALHEYAFPT